MKKYYKLFALLTVAAFLFNCEQDNDSDLSNFVGFEEGPLSYDVAADATKTIEIIVAASETSSSDRSYAVMVDEDLSTLSSVYSVPSTVTIPSGTNVGTLAITVTDNENLGYIAQKLVIDFIDEAGKNYGEAITLNIVQECLDTLVRLSLELDTWPDETTWEIYDLSGAPTVIFSGGPYINPDDDFAELDYDFCLASGQYGVVVYDSYGDGGPTYTVTSAAGILVPATTLGGSSSSATFTVD